jgi:hypothetical protein
MESALQPSLQQNAETKLTVIEAIELALLSPGLAWQASPLIEKALSLPSRDLDLISQLP